MTEQYIREYIDNKNMTKWFKHDEIDIIIGASKFIQNHKETLAKDAENVINEIKHTLPIYMGSIYRLLFYGKGKECKRYITKHVEITLSSEDPDLIESFEKSKEEMRLLLSPEDYDDCFFEDIPVEDGIIPFDISFRDAIIEYTGQEFCEGEQNANVIWYKGIKLNQETNPFYHAYDHMQKKYNDDIAGIIKKILCRRGFYYFYKGRKHFKSFSNVDYDEMDIIIELFFDWFIENTMVGNIFYVQDIVEMDGWADKSIFDVFSETEKYVCGYLDGHDDFTAYRGVNQIGMFSLSDIIRICEKNSWS